MKKLFIAVFSLTLALGLSIGDADAAKRLGGGKSVGMQREAVAPKPAAPAQAAPAPANQPAPAAPTAAQPQPKRNWLGPIAGLAAGLGIAALLSHFGLGEGMANFLMIALLAMAVFFVFKLLFRRKAEPQADSSPLQYAGAGNNGMTPPTAMPPQYGAASAETPVAAASRIPAGFDSEGFLRVAKQYPDMRPEQQARVRERLGRWAAMPPEQRERARDNYRRFHDLPPEERQKVIERFRRHHSPMQGSGPFGPLHTRP